MSHLLKVPGKMSEGGTVVPVANPKIWQTLTFSEASMI